jgi:hypothetical protein
VIVAVVEVSHWTSREYALKTALLVSIGVCSKRSHDPVDSRNVKNSHQTRTEQRVAHSLAPVTSTRSTRNVLFVCLAFGIIL